MPQTPEMNTGLRPFGGQARDPDADNPVMHPATLMGKSTNVPTAGMYAHGMREPSGEDPHAGPAQHPAQHAPPRVVGKAAFEQQRRTVPTPANVATGKLAPPAPSAASTVGAVKTSSILRRGFAHELEKEAGLRDIVRRIVSGKGPAKMRMGFFERRRAAKSMGVKPSQVEHAIQKRQRVGKAVKAGRVAAIAGTGAVAGAKLSKESDND